MYSSVHAMPWLIKASFNKLQSIRKDVNCYSPGGKQEVWLPYDYSHLVANIHSQKCIKNIFNVKFPNSRTGIVIGIAELESEIGISEFGIGIRNSRIWNSGILESEMELEFGIRIQSSGNQKFNLDSWNSEFQFQFWNSEFWFIHVILIL